MSSRSTGRLVVIIVVLFVINVVLWWFVLTSTGRLPTLGGVLPAPPTLTNLPAPTIPVLPAGQPQRSPTAGTPQRSPTVGAPQPGTLTTMDQVTRAINEGRRGTPFRLTFSEDEINHELAVYLAENPDIAFSDVYVSLQNGEAVITGNALVLGFRVGFSARTTVVVENNRPRLKIVRLDVLGGLVPGFVRDRVAAMIEERVNLPLLQDLPVALDQVIIQPGQAVVTGRVA